MTGLILKSFTGSNRSAHFFALMIQALTFDSVPKEARAIASQSIRNIQYTIPLIVEGQKEGTITEGDPEYLATAYWSLVQGLAIMSMESSGSFRLPSTDVVLRLLKS